MLRLRQLDIRSPHASQTVARYLQYVIRTSQAVFRLKTMASIMTMMTTATPTRIMTVR
jgi:hypothetical protein